MSKELNCMNCCIGDFKESLCDCNNGMCKEYKKVGRAEDFEKEVLKRTKTRTADAVEVVRCKECKWWKDQAEGIVESPICTRIHDMVFEMGATDSCTKAERRDADDFEERNASEEN